MPAQGILIVYVFDIEGFSSEDLSTWEGRKDPNHQDEGSARVVVSFVVT